MAIYNNPSGDNVSLELLLRKSIEKVEREKAMGKRKAAAETKERATVSRERKLALALRGMLDGIEDQEPPFEMSNGLVAAENQAQALLKELGYSDLEGIPRRVAKLNEALKVAVENGDGAEISRLGTELTRAKEGKPPKTPVETKMTDTKAKAATD
jgi:hypothetical protein